MPQKFRSAPVICGHTFSRSARRSFENDKVMPTSTAPIATTMRISRPCSLSGPPMSSRRMSSPTTIAEPMNSVNCATVPEMPASTPELVATPTSTPCFCRKRMFITVDDTLVAATMLANEIAICSMVAGSERDRVGHRAERHQRERDRGRLGGDEPGECPRELRGLQRVPEVGEAADLGQDHPEGEGEGHEHHDVERLHPAQLDRLLAARDRCAP